MGHFEPWWSTSSEGGITIYSLISNLKRKILSMFIFYCTSFLCQKDFRLLSVLSVLCQFLVDLASLFLGNIASFMLILSISIGNIASFLLILSISLLVILPVSCWACQSLGKIASFPFAFVSLLVILPVSC